VEADDRQRADECGLTYEAYERAALTLLYYVAAHLLRGEPVRLVPTGKPEESVSLVLDRGIHFVHEMDAQAKHGCSLDELEPRLRLTPAALES
jgi:non-ribosomal peptide synthetase component F